MYWSTKDRVVAFMFILFLSGMAYSLVTKEEEPKNDSVKLQDLPSAEL